MPKKINSASRLIALLSSIPNHAANTQTLSVWAGVFKISETNSYQCANLVSERLGSMYRELAVIRKQMQVAGFSENLYEPALASLESGFSVTRFNEGWSGIQPWFKPEVMIALNYCSEIIPNEEAEISQDALNGIQAELDELQALLADAQLPESLRTLIQHHIDLIFNALAEYPVSGAKALREALRSGVGEIIESTETIKENHQNPAVTKLKDVWKNVNEAVDFALRTERTVQLGHKVYEFIEKIL
jgi:hypothetical protein